jgi:adenylate kinase
MLNIILFGSPGSGKGTQAMNIIYWYRLKHLSTGDILRAEISDGTASGLEAKYYIDNGEMVPDNLVIDMVRERIHCNLSEGFIFDGFPRNISQAQVLDEILKENNSSVSLLIELDVEHTELVRRLINRGKTSGRSDDINLHIIEKRIKIYHEETKPVIDYYKAQDKFLSINGMGRIDAVFSRICKAIAEKTGNLRPFIN